MSTHLKFYNSFYKGLRFQPSKVLVSFKISVPKYMHFISHEESEYMGWDLYFFKQYASHNKWQLRCTKELSISLALIEAIWFRKEVTQSFKLHNPRPVNRRSKKHTIGTWLMNHIDNLIKQEEEYVLRSHPFKNNN